MKLRNSMTFKVFYDLCEPCRRVHYILNGCVNLIITPVHLYKKYISPCTVVLWYCVKRETSLPSLLTAIEHALQNGHSSTSSLAENTVPWLTL